MNLDFSDTTIVCRKALVRALTNCLRKGSNMQKKKLKRVERKPKLRCPNCGQRIDHEITPEEIRVYGHSMLLPRVGEITSCDGCNAMLEYTSDPAAMVLKLASQWRVNSLNEADSIPDHPSLSEILERVRNRKTVRLTDYYGPR